MSRKQLFVDWSTINQLMHNKDKKVIAMPEIKLWNDPNNNNNANHILVPGWINDNLLHDIEHILKQQVDNSRDRIARPSKKEYIEAEAQVSAAFKVETVYDEKTVVVLVVYDKKHPEKNTQRHIHCQNGIGFSGYVHDLGTDSYIVECVDFISLGDVHVSHRVTIPNTGGWMMRVPMPEIVIENLISPYYKRVLADIKNKYPRPDYELHFMQMTSCE